MKKIFLLILVALSLAACEPTLDASSKQAFKTSAAKMRESLSPEKSDEFDTALMVAVFSSARKSNLKGVDVDSVEGILEGNLKVILDGKNVDDVIYYANKIRLEDKRISVVKEIALLEEKRKLANDYLSKLNDSLRITKAVVFLKHPMDRLFLSLTMRNATKRDIYKIHLDILLKNKTKPTEFYSESLILSVRDGLEPSEEPVNISNVGLKQTPKWFTSDNTDVTIKVTGLDNQFERPLFEPQIFSKEDSLRMEKLKIDLPKFH